MKAMIVILFVLLILAVVVCMSLCMVFAARVGELESKITDWELRVENLAEGMRIMNGDLRRVDAITKRNYTSVTQDQVDEARKRAKL